MNTARFNVGGTLALVAGLLLSAASIAAAPAASSSAQSRVIVGFNAGPGAAAAARAAIAQQGGRVTVDLGEIGAVAVEIPAAALAALARSAGVAYVEPDLERHVMGSRLPLGYPAGTAQVVPYGIPMVQADQLSDSNAGSRKLCIIDSGYDIAHEDLQDSGVTGKNLTRSGTWDSDEHSHGTHVAGTVAALANTVGVVGVMPSGNIQLHIEKIFDVSGSARSSLISRAVLNCAAAGANVINMSLGGSVAGRAEERTYNQVAADGVLVIASAGNDGTEVINYPAGYATVMSVAAVDSTGAVADFSQHNADVEIAAPGVAVLSTVPPNTQLGAELTVAGTPYPAIPMEDSPLTSATGTLADFGLGDTVVRGSMTGQVCLIQRGTITFANKVKNCQRSGGIAAVIYNNVDEDLYGTLDGARTSIPSVGITQDDGEVLLTQLGQSATVSVGFTDARYEAYSGTSMSAPHVSAVAALVWSQHLACTAEEIRSSLNKSAMDLGAAGRDDTTGYGLVQAKAASDRITAQGCGN